MSMGLEETCACGSAFACECGSLSSSPALGEGVLREDLPKVLFSLAWKQRAWDVGKESLLQGRSGSQPASVCKPAFLRHQGGVPAGKHPFC